ncbi:terminase [Streptomyces lycii]|uniref:Terminase n=1 Tax=Streptomyces lycii TaxID=2654337 RepID=A0ABQ7FJ78_9ACTN|nr:terminase [Streptomyces lycii]
MPNGAQRPRIFTAPEYASTTGQEAIELAAEAGLILDPWQQLVLTQGLGERADGKWSAFEVCVNVPRQNGKGAIIEARQLAGLFLLNEQLILHSAHEFKTSIEAFRRVESLISNCDMLRKRVHRVRRTTGEEAIELLTGQRLRFLARSGGSGRGFTGDCNILDEAMILGDDAMGALMPTMSARPNPQLWYLGSAGIGAPSKQLGRLRARALAGGDAALAYMEWSADTCRDECPPDCAEHDSPDDEASWAKANPSLGIRISAEHIGRERLSMSDEIFATERLGVGNYPSDAAAAWPVISEAAWNAITDDTAAPAAPLTFAIEVTPERTHAAIGVAGPFGDRRAVEVIDHRTGTSWVLKRALELQERWKPIGFVIDAGSPAGSLVPEFEKAGLNVITPRVRDIAQACGMFFDAVADQSIAHRNQAPLRTALAAADRRPLGDAWAWARRGTGTDISPLVAVTLALWGSQTYVETEEPEPWIVFR